MQDSNQQSNQISNNSSNPPIQPWLPGNSLSSPSINEQMKASSSGGNPVQPQAFSNVQSQPQASSSVGNPVQPQAFSNVQSQPQASSSVGNPIQSQDLLPAGASPTQSSSVQLPGQTQQVQTTQPQAQFKLSQALQPQIASQSTATSNSLSNLPPSSQPQHSGSGSRNLPPRSSQRSAPDPKKVLIGILSFFGCSITFFVLFVIIFVSQTTPTGENGLARSLGVDVAGFTNSLIFLTNVLFGIFALTTFILAIIGLFSSLMAKKDDKITKAKGTKKALFGGLAFLMILMTWIFIYIYLSGKQVVAPKVQTVSEIVTEPSNTLLLTAPVEILFDATKIPNNSAQTEIVSYLWTFGDGETATTPKVSHTYSTMGPNEGRYDVTLSITKRDIRTGSLLPPETYSKIVTIANVKLVPDFTFTPETGPAPLKVNFDASNSKAPSGQISEYSWDFNEDNVFRDAEGVKATHTFQREGTYKVSLRVTDNTGQEPGIITKEIVVTGLNLPKAEIETSSPDGKFYQNRQYTFYGEKSSSPNGAITKYEWDFGDGSPKSNSRTANHTYSKSGEYTLTLKVTDSTGKIAEKVQNLKVEVQKAGPTAIITSIPAPVGDQKIISGRVPFEVVLSGEKSSDPDNDIVEYKWDFENTGNFVGSGEKQVYTYKVPGTYNLTLLVIDSEGNESRESLQVRVEQQGLTAKITADQIEGSSPMTVKFDASGSTYPEGRIVSYEWDFGDGSPRQIGSAQISYRYEKVGNFNAKVTAKASDGTTSTSELQISVRPVPLNACYLPNKKSGPAPLTVEFDPRCTTGTIAKYFWDFGDGNTSRTRRPTHTFKTPGSYNVKLEVTDSQNLVNSYSDNILVTGEIE